MYLLPKPVGSKAEWCCPQSKSFIAIFMVFFLWENTIRSWKNSHYCSNHHNLSSGSHWLCLQRLYHLGYEPCPSFCHIRDMLFAYTQRNVDHHIPEHMINISIPDSDYCSLFAQFILWLFAGLALLNALLNTVISPLASIRLPLLPKKQGSNDWSCNWWDKVVIAEFSDYCSLYIIVIHILLFNAMSVLLISQLAEAWGCQCLE